MESARLHVPQRLLLGLGLLLPFSFIPGVSCQNVEVLQSPEHVSVAVGEPATLSCKVITTVVGPVQWYKGSGQERKLFYSYKKDEGSFPGVSAVPQTSPDDFNILINNVSTEDAATYYCVKIVKGREFPSAAGTKLSVSAPPSAPVLSCPLERVEIRTPVDCTCTSEGFVPETINVTWLKDDVAIRAAAASPSISKASSSFRMESRITRIFSKEDIKSRISCQIMHKTLSNLLVATVSLSEVLKVSPSVKLLIFPAPKVLVNESVRISCGAEQFYPHNINVRIHSQKGNTVNLGDTETETIADDGTYSLTRTLQLNATEQWNHSVFTCEVRHLGKKFESEPAVLVIVTEDASEGGGSLIGTTPSPRGMEQFLYYVIAACLGLLLILVLAIVIFMRTKKKRDKDTENRRSMRSSGTGQALAAKDITYADLEIQQRHPNPRSAIVQNDHSEYASVQAGAQPQKDNVTYADLDTVRLNQGPRKARDRAAGDHSEYAEVQTRKQ